MGMTTRMKMVELINPPTAERAKDDQILCLPTSSWIKTRGSMPRTVVLEVRKMGRILSREPFRTASRRGSPSLLFKLI
jgi:hypothetical protein